MVKRSWLLVLPLVLSLLWLGTPPSHAAGESWKVTGVNVFGCHNYAWDLDTTFSGLDGPGYSAHTVVSSGGLVYMNEDVSISINGDSGWGLYANSSYGPTSGTYPIPPGQPMKAVFTVERPKGHVLSSWTMVAASCDSGILRYNGATSADGDQDFVPILTDACPTIQAFRANGCPLRARSLALTAKSSRKRVVGKLVSPGFPSLQSGRSVTIWKVRPGPDLRIATRSTSSLGTFKARVGKGRYYATSPDVVVPTVGQAAADRSGTVRVR